VHEGKYQYIILITQNSRSTWTLLAELLVQNSCNGRVGLKGTVYASIALKLLFVNYEIWKTPVSVPTDILIE